MKDKLMQQKETFEKLASKYIDRPGIDDLLDFLSQSDFYNAPASTIYHGSYPGGLCEHSLNVFNSLVHECETSLGENWQDDISIESIAIVALFHDLCKVNTYEIYQRNVKNDNGKWEQIDAYRKNVKFPMGHGAKSVFMLNAFIEITPEEGLALYWHMGAFDIGNYSTVNELSKAYETCQLAFLLHIADMKTTYITENK